MMSGRGIDREGGRDERGDGGRAGGTPDDSDLRDKQEEERRERWIGENTIGGARRYEGVR